MSNVSELKSNPILGVMQGEFGITNSRSKTYCVGTGAIGPCVGLFIWNPFFKQAVCAHLDYVRMTADAVDKFILESGLIISKGMPAYLVGGYKDLPPTSKQRMNEIIALLENKYKCDVNRKDLFKKRSPDEMVQTFGMDKSVAFGCIEGFVVVYMDSRTGQLVKTDKHIALNYEVGTNLSLLQRTQNVLATLVEDSRAHLIGKVVPLRKGANADTGVQFVLSAPLVQFLQEEAIL